MRLKTRRIISDPRICSGKPCIRGTRIPVHIILGLLSAGETQENIIKAYPHITNKDIKACLEYADEEAGNGTLDI